MTQAQKQTGGKPDVATEKAVGAIAKAAGRNSIRRRSSRKLWGLPLYDIAFGPDLAKGELRGHARGIIAVGDVATGGLAVGGMAGGVIAIGGLSAGVISVGGCSAGLAAAIGGVALGGWAFGGVAIGILAIGGKAIGFFT